MSDGGVMRSAVKRFDLPRSTTKKVEGRFAITPEIPDKQCLGGVAEWSIAPVLKTGEPQGSVGSNPTSSAKLLAGRISANAP